MTYGRISSRLDLTYASSTIISQKPTEHELDLLFQAVYDDYISGQPLDAPRTAHAAPANQTLQTPNASTTIANFAPTPTISSKKASTIPNTSHDVDELQQQQHSLQQDNQAQLQPEVVVDNGNNVMFDENMFINPFAPPSTNLAESSSHTMEPSNVKEAMTNPGWIDLMQEELLQFKNKLDEENTIIRN
ncbi:hypothetical protein Tco_0805175, partial [Tanacetum coccineum]